MHFLKQNRPIPLPDAPLFASIGKKERESLLACLGAREKRYAKGAPLLSAGETTVHFGLVLSGTLRIVKEDYNGNTILLALVSPGELFAEAFAAGGFPLTVSVLAEEDAAVLWLDYRRLLTPCQNACPFHAVLAGNLLRILGRKNVFLTGRIEHLSKKSLREKVLSYLSEQAVRQGSRHFTIPLNRQALADYLAADRSALSAVLSRLQKEGVLTFRKNEFTLF